ncbi:MAG: SpoIID/LytB domain-containing protein [Spirochaetota bacterium]
MNIKNRPESTVKKIKFITILKVLVYIQPLLLLSFLPCSGGTSVIESEPVVEKADWMWWQGAYPEAVDMYRGAAEIEELELPSRVNLGAHYRSQGSYQAAIDQYLLIISKKLAAAPEILTHVYISLAESFYYIGRAEQARIYFQKALELSPFSHRAVFGLGRAVYALGALETAQTLFNRASSLQPGFPGNYLYLGRIHQKNNNLNKALDCYAQALQRDGYQVEIAYTMGEIYQSMELFDDAFKHFHQLETVDPHNKYVKTQISQVRPYLTRKEEELVASRRLEKFSSFKQTASPGNIPLLKVGINTSHTGSIIPMERITFRSSGSFIIASGDQTIFQGKPSAQYTISRQNRKVLLKSKHTSSLLLPDSFIIQPESTAKHSIIIEKIEYARGFSWGGIEDRQYRGSLEVTAKENGFMLANLVNLEEYLYSVVPSEMMISFPMEALKAQAVIARSYALHRKMYIHPHKDDGFHLCDSQHCQVYRGIANEWERTTRAVDMTRGEVLAYNGKIAHPLFHSNCGGHTQSSGNLKGWGKVPYLTGATDGPPETDFPSSPAGIEQWIKTRPPVYCNHKNSGWDPEFRWFRLVPSRFVQEKVDRRKDIGTITGVSTAGRNPSGYVSALRIKGTSGSLFIEKQHLIRRILGIGPLRSTLFWIDTRFDREGLPQEFVIYGGGWGHGVGMCQNGAAGMAEKGFTYQEILNHYYRNTKIEKLEY